MRRFDLPAFLKSSVVALFLIFLSIPEIYGAGETERYNLAQKTFLPKPISESPKEKNEFLIDSYYSISDVVEGSRRGHWSEFTNLAMVSQERFKIYASISEYDRLDLRDHSANLGLYLPRGDSLLRVESGFGWDVHYLYRYQNVIEYSHKISDGLYAQANYTYRHYAINDSHLVSPGLIYYFGDSYIMANYGASIIESRGVGHSGTVRGDFALTDRLHWVAGVTVGEWLYDIAGLDPGKEGGYSLLTGVKVDVYKGLNLRAGFSYDTEKPKFIKRNLDLELSFKF